MISELAAADKKQKWITMLKGNVSAICIMLGTTAIKNIKCIKMRIRKQIGHKITNNIILSKIKCKKKSQ